MLNYPQVELDFMNRDHAEFVGLRESLLAALAQNAAPAAIEDLLDRLLAHTRSHFAEEEHLMRQVGFPPYPMHKGEHDRVLANMETQTAKWKQNGDAQALHEWLERAVGDWFINHVSAMDFVTARYIAAHLPS